MDARFVTTAGVVGRTRSSRRYVVVEVEDAEIRYRTDDLYRARTRRRFLGPRHVDIIDTHTGEVVT